MSQNSSNTKVTKFDNILFRNEHILAFDVSVQDLAIMYMLHTKTDLGKPIHDLGFREVPSALVCYKLCKITSISEVHDNTKMAFLCFVKLPESHNVWMVQYFENLCLFECLFFLSFTHLSNVDLFDDTQISVTFTFNKIRLAKRTFAE